MAGTELSGYLGRAQCKFAISQIALVPAWRVTRVITGPRPPALELSGESVTRNTTLHTPTDPKDQGKEKIIYISYPLSSQNT